MIKLSRVTKAICIVAVLSSAACTKLPDTASGIEAATVTNANRALFVAIGLTAIGFGVAASRL